MGLSATGNLPRPNRIYSTKKKEVPSVLLQMLATAEWYSISQIHSYLRNLPIRAGGRLHAALSLCERIEAISCNSASVDFSTSARNLSPKTDFLLCMALQHLRLIRINLLLHRDSGAKYHAKLFYDFLHMVANELDLHWTPDQDALQEHRYQPFLSRLKSQIALKECLHVGKVADRMTIVLGMHRSGTSALTGMLCQAGYDAPNDLMPVKDANPKGHWESWSIYLLNDRYLKELGSTWGDPHVFANGWEELPITAQWRDDLLDHISRVFVSSAHPILKDPRLCILAQALRPWFESQTIRWSFILPIRHPFEVARSLELRENVPISDGIRLWLRYVFSAEYSTRGYPRCIHTYEQLIDSPQDVLSACIAVMSPDGFQETGESSVEFVDAGLRHQTMSLVDEYVEASTPRISAEKLMAKQLYSIMARATIDCSINYKSVDHLREQWRLLAFGDH